MNFTYARLRFKREEASRCDAGGRGASADNRQLRVPPRLGSWLISSTAAWRPHQSDEHFPPRAARKSVASNDDLSSFPRCSGLKRPRRETVGAAKGELPIEQRRSSRRTIAKRKHSCSSLILALNNLSRPNGQRHVWECVGPSENSPAPGCKADARYFHSGPWELPGNP